MMEWFLALALIEQIGVVLGALDIVLGSAPDKFTAGYPGVLLSLAHKLHQYGKDVK